MYCLMYGVLWTIHSIIISLARNKIDFVQVLLRDSQMFRVDWLFDMVKHNADLPEVGCVDVFICHGCSLTNEGSSKFRL